MQAEAQNKPPAGADQPGCQVDQFLNDRADAAAFDRVADRGELAEQSHLADSPEDVVGKGTQRWLHLFWTAFCTF